MLTPTQILAIKYRAKLVQANLRNCHSGCDIHEVGNMLNTVEGILQVVEDPETDESILDLLDRVEAQQVEFFKRKFPASIASRLSDVETEKVTETSRTEVSHETSKETSKSSSPAEHD